MPNRDLRNQDRERLRVCVAFCQDATTVVGDRQDAVARRAGDAEAVLDSAQKGHAPVPPTIRIEIPRGHQEQPCAGESVFAAKAWKIHILADGHAPESGRLCENFTRGADDELGFKRGKHVVLFVCARGRAVGGVDSGFVPQAIRIAADHADDYDSAGSSSSVRKQRVDFGNVCGEGDGDLLGNDYCLDVLARERVHLCGVVAEKAKGILLL